MVQSPARSPSYAVPALEKGLDILECLSRRRAPMTQAQIARELGRGAGELFRMLTVLERRGYLHRDPDSNAYDLTLRLFELGQSHSPYDSLLRAARLPMRDLAIRIGQSCHLAVIEHDHVMVLHHEDGMTRVRLSVAVGSTIPIVECVSGRLLLAQMADDERAEALRGVVAVDAMMRDGNAGLLEQLDVIRRLGFDSSRSEQTEGCSDLAVLIGTSESRTQASLAVPALTRDHDAFVAAALPEMRACADEIGRSAGLIDPVGAVDAPLVARADALPTGPASARHDGID